MIDFARARAETPGCAERIHLNNAGAALMSRRVVDTQLDHLRLEARIGGYEAARVTEDAFEDVYKSIARLIGTCSGLVINSITCFAVRAALRPTPKSSKLPVTRTGTAIL